MFALIIIAGFTVSALVLVFAGCAIVSAAKDAKRNNARKLANEALRRARVEDHFNGSQMAWVRNENCTLNGARRTVNGF
ncbi:gp97 [Corynebacterium phage P1201]|uniref:Gp97 n=1 Tax=Corynebacterium phage P1201 TaxID=384848 RepID=A7IYG4_9CAUD|nr:gp97 [Corynebacterium phage P1201]ABF57547.1 gp97 [Corynebacterium phage P1201]